VTYRSKYKLDLTPRQRAVLDLMARGHTTAEIAEALQLSLDGAKWHVREILGKLGVDSREEAADWWKQNQRPSTRIRHALAAAAAPFASKPATIVSGTVFGGALLAFGLFVVAPREPANPQEACRPADIRLRASDAEDAEAGHKLEVRAGLRDREWYEGMFHPLHLADAPVHSPCMLDTTVTVDIRQRAELAGSHSEVRTNVPGERLAAIPGNPATVPVRLSLTSGEYALLLQVELGPVCEPGGALADIEVIVARDAGGITTSQSLFVPLDPGQCESGGTVPEFAVVGTYQ
jgi:DNA-binding CsgD family transcriptional regulator